MLIFSSLLISSAIISKCDVYKYIAFNAKMMEIRLMGIKTVAAACIVFVILCYTDCI